MFILGHELQSAQEIGLSMEAIATKHFKKKLAGTMPDRNVLI